MMAPVVKLSAAERIINALIHLPRKRADDFMARQQKEATVIQPIVDEFVADARRDGVIEGRAQAEAEMQSKIDAAVAAEREECAKECERIVSGIGSATAAFPVRVCASQIRARSGAKGV